MFFSNKDLRDLIIPLFVEQFLLLLVGMADTFVVSYAGDAAVSGVSLVNSFNTVFVFLFTALSSGGAVIISQYIGCGNNKAASRASGQLLMISTVFSVIVAALCLIFQHPLLRGLFGSVDDDVMQACITYLRITALSFPPLAIYDAGAALCRSIGHTKATMNISIVANIINIAGNCIGVFVLHAGVAGVAWPSFISRTISAAAVTIYCFSPKLPVSYHTDSIFGWQRNLLRKIMYVAIPNGVENGVHQLVKVALSSMVALFGTYPIAANGVAQSIWSLASLMGLAMAPVYTTVIGQCMGAGDINQADYYFKKLDKISFILSIAWNALVLALTPLLLKFFAISPQAKSLVFWLVLINNIMNGIAYPFAGPLGNGLRAAGDIRFTMIVSISLTIGARLFFSALFGLWLNMGVIGIAFGMGIDLFIRGAIFYARYRSKKWTKFKLI